MRSKEQERQYQLARYHKRRSDAIKNLGGKCVKCDSQKDLEIDHIDPGQKTYSVGAMWGIAKTKYEEELKKCQLLCRTCHREKTTRETISEKHGTWGWVRNRKCKCDICKEFVRNYQRKYSRRTGSNPVGATS